MSDTETQATRPRCYPVVERRGDGYVAWYPEHGVEFHGRTAREAYRSLPARRVEMVPRRRTLPDGTVHLSHPEYGVEATGPDHETAFARLRVAMRACLRDPEMARLHFRLGESPPPHWRVHFESRDDAIAALLAGMDPSEVTEVSGLLDEAGFTPLEGADLAAARAQVEIADRLN